MPMTNVDPTQSLAIFLVEAENFIRMMVPDILEELGHRVVAEAGSIEDAETLALSSAFDFAILDVTVGGYDVWPVAEIVESRGLFFRQRLRRDRASDAVSWKKPFLRDNLDETINAAVNPG